MPLRAEESEMMTTNAEYAAAMNQGAPEGYGITAYSGPETEGATRYYFTIPTYLWDPKDIGKPPKQKLYDTRDEAVAAAVAHDQ